MAISGSNASSPVKGVSARHRIRSGIEELILSGTLKPGQRLIQQELAKQFGVAQSVIRESLLELQFTGLVQGVDNLGMFVGELDAKRLIQAYQIREVFEGLAARLCCDNATRADLRNMNELVEQMYQLGKKGLFSEMSALDYEFHNGLIKISGNHVLGTLTEAYRALGMVIRADRDLDLIRSEHQAVVTAIEKNNPEEAERCARHHVREVCKVIEQKTADGTFNLNWILPPEE